MANVQPALDSSVLANRPDAGWNIAVCFRHLGFFSLNACRIVYLVDEDESIKRYGFAYGTLPDHGESGEERFIVEWDLAEDRVWYEILARSRPQQMLAKLGYPLSRSLQRKFAAGSKRAMLQVVTGT